MAVLLLRGVFTHVTASYKPRAQSYTSGLLGPELLLKLMACGLRQQAKRGLCSGDCAVPLSDTPFKVVGVPWRMFLPQVPAQQIATRAAGSAGIVAFVGMLKVLLLPDRAFLLDLLP